jgi:hemolysin III
LPEYPDDTITPTSAQPPEPVPDEAPEPTTATPAPDLVPVPDPALGAVAVPVPVPAAGTGTGLADALLSTGPAAALASVLVKPRLRGVFHQWAFVVSLFTGVFLVLRATTTVATIAAAVYAAGISGLFGVSALYHRITWRPNVRRWLRQLDHAMIFLLIAGTYTPVGLLVLNGPLGVTVLWLAALVYVILGWVAVVTMPQLLERMGIGGVALIVLGGLVYSVGAIVYATRRPNPAPAVFGYHEIFHLLVIAGVAFHFAAISRVVLGGA